MKPLLYFFKYNLPLQLPTSSTKSGDFNTPRALFACAASFGERAPVLQPTMSTASDASNVNVDIDAVLRNMTVQEFDDSSAVLPPLQGLLLRMQFRLRKLVEHTWFSNFFLVWILLIEVI